MAAQRTRPRAIAAAAFLGVTLTGCLSGALYSRITVPLDVNLNRTPVHEDHRQDSVDTFQYYLRVDWGSNGIGDVASRHGLKRVYYADLETLTVLGIWQERWLHVYGELESGN